MTTKQTLYNFTVKNKKGQDVSLSQYEGKVVLVVNTATQCGLTPQLEGLEKLWEQYKDEGLVVIGFPCNQFANQNPGDDEQTHEFCALNYGVSFPMMGRVNVNGRDADALYQWLKREKGGWFGSAIKWNFTKFLINRKGEVVDRFSPATVPAHIEKYIVNEINRTA